MPDIACQQHRTCADGGSSDGEVGTIDGVVAGKPASAEETGLFRDVSVGGVPGQSRKKYTPVLLFGWTHASEDLQTCDFARVQYVRRPLALQDCAGIWVTAKIVDQNRRVDECAHNLCCPRREPERRCSTHAAPSS
ncbi:MAG: hypothetical protein ACP5HZ_10765, partial [Ferrimicrobium sp.]